MRYDLAGLRSDTIAHIFAAIGIASLLRDHAKVGWDKQGMFPYIETNLARTEVNAALDDGITLLIRKARRLYQCNLTPIASTASSVKAQGKRGRPKEATSKESTRGLSVAKLSEELDRDDADESFREMAASMASIVSATSGVSRKPRSMLGKTLLYQTAANDLVRYGKMKSRLGILEELADPDRMASWIGNVALSGAKGQTGYDHVANMLNAGINQSALGKAKCAHPIIEMLAIEGLCAFPVQPSVSNNPRNRGMEGAATSLRWIIPVWNAPLSYYAIEDFVAADIRSFSPERDVLVVRKFEFFENGNVQALRPTT